MTSPKSDLSVQYIHEVYSMQPKKPVVGKDDKPKRASPKKKTDKATTKVAKTDPT